MNKEDLTTYIAKNSSLTKEQAHTAITLICHKIRESVSNNENVTLTELGTFSLKERKERRIRDFHTKEIVTIPSHIIPSFKPSKAFKNAIK